MRIDEMTNKQLFAACLEKYPDICNTDRKTVRCPACGRTWAPMFVGTLKSGTCDSCVIHQRGDPVAEPTDAASRRDADIAWYVRHGIPANYAAIVVEQAETKYFCTVSGRQLKAHLSALIHGGTGVGKTTLAFRLMAFRYSDSARGKKAMFATAYEICQEYEGAGRRNTSNEQTRDRITAKYSAVPWLCIDDLSSRDMAHWETERLFGIINNRSSRALPTVITSQHNQFAFEQAFGQRGSDIVSRIGEHGCFIELTGPDLRRVENE